MSRKLKKPVRRILTCLGIGAEIACASLITSGNIYSPQSTVHAEADTKTVISTISKLKNQDLSKMSMLKTYILDNYQATNLIEDLDVSKSKVLLVTPSVVTKPTVDNSSIVIVPEYSSTQKEEKKEENAVTDDLSSVEKLPVQEKEEKAEDAVLPEPSFSEENKTETGADTVQTASEDVKNDEQKKENAPENPATENEKADEGENRNTETAVTANKPSENPASADVAQGAQSIDGEKSTVPDFAKSVQGEGVVELSDNGNRDAQEKEHARLDLALTSDHVVIEDGSEFVAENYIDSFSNSDGTLPVLKIAGSVNSEQDGEYTVTYTLVSADGTTVSKNLKVTVKGNEEARLAREAADQAAIDAFAAKYDGKQIDVDGYYGDQCWDLWARFVCDQGLYDKYDCSCGKYRYVYGVYKKYDKTGAKKYFEKIEDASEVEKGDWLFWDKGSSCADSHVALLLKNNGDGTGVCLTQSYGNGTRILTLDLDVMGAFRPVGQASWRNIAA